MNITQKNKKDLAPLLVLNPNNQQPVNLTPMFEFCFSWGEEKDNGRLKVIRDKIYQIQEHVNVHTEVHVSYETLQFLQEINFWLYRLIEVIEKMEETD